MSERCYAIEMQTPIGIKHGTIKVNISQGEISGYLDVMNHSEPFLEILIKMVFVNFRGILLL